MLSHFFNLNCGRTDERNKITENSPNCKAAYDSDSPALKHASKAIDNDFNKDAFQTSPEKKVIISRNSNNGSGKK